eukprot:442221-Hanusia_phi.AAC.3
MKVMLCVASARRDVVRSAVLKKYCRGPTRVAAREVITTSCTRLRNARMGVIVICRAVARVVYMFCFRLSLDTRYSYERLSLLQGNAV